MKSKVHPREYGDEPATITEAFRDLSKQAFAVWIRLMIEPMDTLSIGRRGIATMLGYSERRFGDVINELDRKGYISLVRPDVPGEPTRIVLRRKAKVNMRMGSWVRLGVVFALFGFCQIASDFGVGIGGVIEASRFCQIGQSESLALRFDRKPRWDPSYESGVKNAAVSLKWGKSLIKVG